MNDLRNRDRPASQLTKREEAALRIYTSTQINLADSVRVADLLFDELDTPHELRGTYEEHE